MRIALTGGSGTGKTTLSRYLAEHHGFTIINFTDRLKAIYAKEYRIPIEEVERNKDRYRRELEWYSNTIGFSSDPGYVLAAIAEHQPLTGNVVFDNVAYSLQAQPLIQHNFYIIKLHCSEEVRKQRAEEKGVKYYGNDPRLTAVDPRFIDGVIDAAMTTEQMANELLGVGV